MFDKILCYSSQNSNRFEYVIHLIFTEILGLDVFFTQNLDAYKTSNLPKIECTTAPIIKGELWFETNALLFEKGISNLDILSTFRESGVLTKIFLLVSRYEEYIAPPSVLDVHGRFSAQKSISSHVGFIEKPIVNQWVMQIREQLTHKYPHLKIKPIQYQVQLTYDIDQAWAFKNKGFFRNIGGFFRDVFKGHFNHAMMRAAVILSIKNDPEYTFDYIEKRHKKLGETLLNPIFFWLLADFGEFDKNISWTNKDLQRLIRRIAKKYAIGIHPSYASNTDYDILKTEINRLETINTEGVKRSRQHYLKLTFPSTYQRLLRAGIMEDYSMGYADNIGFRAGIASPFYWYDLENERMTALRIFPFQVMEVTLKEYLHLSPDDAIAQVKTMIDETKKVGGTFTTLWHNSSLSDRDEYEGWRRVYEEITDYAVS